MNKLKNIFQHHKVLQKNSKCYFNKSFTEQIYVTGKRNYENKKMYHAFILEYFPKLWSVTGM